MRIFVLSIDQKYYWGAFTLVLMLVLFRHFFPGRPEVEAEKGTYTSVVFTDIEYWQNNFMTYSNSPAEQDFIKRELIQLLTSMYASTQDGTPQFLVLDAIKEKQSLYLNIFMPSSSPKNCRINVPLSKRH